MRNLGLMALGALLLGAGCKRNDGQGPVVQPRAVDPALDRQRRVEVLSRLPAVARETFVLLDWLALSTAARSLGEAARRLPAGAALLDRLSRMVAAKGLPRTTSELKSWGIDTDRPAAFASGKKLRLVFGLTDVARFKSRTRALGRWTRRTVGLRAVDVLLDAKGKVRASCHLPPRGWATCTRKPRALAALLIDNAAAAPSSLWSVMSSDQRSRALRATALMGAPSLGSPKGSTSDRMSLISVTLDREGVALSADVNLHQPPAYAAALSQQMSRRLLPLGMGAKSVIHYRSPLQAMVPLYRSRLLSNMLASLSGEALALEQRDGSWVVVIGSHDPTASAKVLDALMVLAQAQLSRMKLAIRVAVQHKTIGDRNLYLVTVRGSGRTSPRAEPIDLNLDLALTSSDHGVVIGVAPRFRTDGERAARVAASAPTAVSAALVANTRRLAAMKSAATRRHSPTR